MGLGTRFNWPPTVNSDADRYRYLYAALEAVRLKHNEKEVDLSLAAEAYRSRCRALSSRIGREIVELRPKVRTPGWVGETPHDHDPALVQGKADGKAAYATVDIKTFTGTDLDKP